MSNAGEDEGWGVRRRGSLKKSENELIKRSQLISSPV